jgi:hypothetical protein
MNSVVEKLSILILPIIVFGIICGYEAISKKRIVGQLINLKIIFYFLLLWNVIGFILKLDYTRQIGCIIMPEPIFSIPNIAFFLFSTSLLLIGKTRIDKVGTLILLCELVIWIFKFLFIKGGYSVGYGGVPQYEILCFDIIAVLLRIMFLQLRFRTEAKILTTALITLFIVFLRIL